MFNSKWIAAHGETAYYLSKDHKLNKIHLTTRAETEVPLPAVATGKKVVDFSVSSQGILSLLTEDGMVVRGERSVRLRECKRYLHLLQVGARLVCVGYDRGKSEMTVCTVTGGSLVRSVEAKMKVEYAPYCVQTAPLDEQDGHFLLFVGEYWSSTRVTVYSVDGKTVQQVAQRRVLPVGSDGRLW